MKSKNMFIRNRNLWGAGLLASAFISLSSANGATVLAVDLHQTTNNAQAGFSLWQVSPDNKLPSSKVFGVFTVTTAAGPTKAFLDGTEPDPVDKNTRARVASAVNSGSFTQEILLRERLVALGSPAAGNTLANVNGTGNGLYFKVEGLTASTTYSLQVWGIDWTGGTTPGTATAKAGYNAIYDETSTLTSLGSYSIGSNVMTVPDNDSFSVKSNITSDANGVIIFKSISNMDGSGIMNGFTISDVPEPGSALLGLLGLAMLVGKRRR